MSLNAVFAILIAVSVATGDSPPKILRDPSFLQLLNKHYSSAQAPRTYWPYDYSGQRYQEELHRRTPEGISHNYASYPHKSKTVPHQQSMESSSPPSSYPTSSQEYWSPSSVVSWNTTHTRTGYSSPYGGLTSSAGGASFSSQDEPEGSHSMYQYQQVRPTASPMVKKHPAYYIKSGIKGMETVGKPKYKTPLLYYSPSGYKKTVYPRVQKPYTMLKYPTKKIVHPFYRRYYQSPYQQYPISSNDLLRQKIKKHSGYSDLGYYKTSDSSTATVYPSTRYQTTERMDDTYPEDYSSYNETNYKTSPNYYETYEEVENTTSAPDPSSYDETTTRGYYGDRIYMSTQVPIKASPDKTTIKNKYLIVRRTSGDDDIETIFE